MHAGDEVDLGAGRSPLHGADNLKIEDVVSGDVYRRPGILTNAQRRQSQRLLGQRNQIGLWSPPAFQ